MQSPAFIFVRLRYWACLPVVGLVVLTQNARDAAAQTAPASGSPPAGAGGGQGSPADGGGVPSSSPGEASSPTPPTSAAPGVNPSAPGSPEAGEGEPQRELSTIVVTGTRRTERTVFESSVPVDVISTSDLKATPSSDLNDKLAASVPSYKVVRMPLADGAIFNRPASLRGLSPDQTLVLINGKRRHRSAFVDVTTMGAQAPDLAEIPLSAIDHIEVLRDGASAQYGSDAIAGVINIILKDKPGFQGYGQWGQYYAGDGTSYLLGASQGLSLGDRGTLNVSIEGSLGNATSRSNQRPNAAALIAAGNTSIQQPVVQRYGLPDTKSFLAFANAKYRLTPAAELYVFGSFGYMWGENDFNWRNPKQGSVFVSSQDAAVVQAKLGNLPSEYGNWYNNNPAVLSGYPGGFTPKFSATSIDTSAVAGVRGDLAQGLNWDLSGRFGRNHILYKIRNSINASEGPFSPTEFKDGTKTQTEFGGNLDFNYLWAAGLAQPINVAFGAEARSETYGAGLGDWDSYALGPLAVIGLAGGSNGFFGTGPTQTGSWGRGSFAGYVDVDADVTRILNAGAALRAEDFTDAGGTVNGKISSRLALAPSFNLRGAFSTGFRAPTPGQANLTNTNQYPSPDGSAIQTNGTIPPTNPIAALVGGKQLKPEQSLNGSLGFVTEPFKRLTLSADGYLIFVKDRIGLSQSYSLTPDQQAGLIASGVAAAQGLTSFNFFVNGYDTRTAGLDFVVSYLIDLQDSGKINLTGTANFNKTEVQSFQAGVIGPYQRWYLEDFLPKHSQTLQAEYEIGKVGVRARARNYGAWTWVASSTDVDANGNLNEVQQLRDRCLFDVSASYHLLEGTQLTVGVDNVFDTYPEKARFPNTKQAADAGQIPSNGNKYPSRAPYPLNGGYYFARLTVNL